MAENTAIAAGWYQLPGDYTKEGYWDGNAWTDQIRPRANMRPLYQEGPWDGTTLTREVARPYNVAEVLGIFSLVVNPFLIPSILCIIFALAAMRRGRAVSERTGIAFRRGYGQGLLTLGIMSTLLGTVIFGTVVFCILASHITI